MIQIIDHMPEQSIQNQQSQINTNQFNQSQLSRPSQSVVIQKILQNKKSGFILHQSPVKKQQKYKKLGQLIEKYMIRNAMEKLKDGNSYSDHKKNSFIYAIVDRLPPKYKQDIRKIIDDYESQIIYSNRIINQLEFKLNQLKNKKKIGKDFWQHQTKKILQSSQTNKLKTLIKQFEHQIYQKDIIIKNLKQVKSASKQIQIIHPEFDQLTTHNQNLLFELNKLKDEIKQMYIRESQLNVTKQGLINQFSCMQTKIQTLERILYERDQENIDLKQKLQISIMDYQDKYEQLFQEKCRLERLLNEKNREIKGIQEINTELEIQFQKIILKLKKIQQQQQQKINRSSMKSIGNIIRLGDTKSSLNNSKFSQINQEEYINLNPLIRSNYPQNIYRSSIKQIKNSSPTIVVQNQRKPLQNYYNQNRSPRILKKVSEKNINFEKEIQKQNARSPGKMASTHLRMKQITEQKEFLKLK